MLELRVRRPGRCRLCYGREGGAGGEAAPLPEQIADVGGGPGRVMGPLDPMRLRSS